MGKSWVAALLPLVAWGSTLWLTGVVQAWLRRRAILDHPVARSSHTVPVPRGAGLALVPVLLACWSALVALGAAPPATTVPIAAAAGLAFLSWRDDRRHLPAALRLAGHIIAAAAGIAALGDAPVFQGLLPPLLDRIAALLLWVWFINLYNFMDGIDGITAVETACLGLGGAAALAAAGMAARGEAVLALCAAAAALGFLRWNWHPARIFLGDVGSVPLGFVMGWLLLRMAANGLWAPALVLPLYYLADATLTLIGRLGRGERIWEAHRRHFYQRALAGGSDHRPVVRIILAGDVLLMVLAVLAAWRPWPALALAAASTAGTLLALAYRARRGAAPA